MNDMNLIIVGLAILAAGMLYNVFKKNKKDTDRLVRSILLVLLFMYNYLIFTFHLSNQLMGQTYLAISIILIIPVIFEILRLKKNRKK